MEKSLFAALIILITTIVIGVTIKLITNHRSRKEETNEPKSEIDNLIDMVDHYHQIQSSLTRLYQDTKAAKETNNHIKNPELLTQSTRVLGAILKQCIILDDEISRVQQSLGQQANTMLPDFNQLIKDSSS